MIRKLMGSILNRLVNWLLSAVTILVLMILAFLGWYKYLMAGVLLAIGIVVALVSTFFMRGQVDTSSPFESPMTSRQRTTFSIVTLLAALLLFTLAILILAGFIQP
jgi:hypothetical protein